MKIFKSQLLKVIKPFQRKLLHEFIIFAVNTGIRVGGILNLKWEDVITRDKKQDYLEKGIEKVAEWSASKEIKNSLNRWVESIR